MFIRLLLFKGVSKNYFRAGKGGKVREMSPDQGVEALSLLRLRNGRVTVATLTNGSVCEIWNIAWGRDSGADFDHITTNVSPSMRGTSVDFFNLSELVSLADKEGRLLFRAS